MGHVKDLIELCGIDRDQMSLNCFRVFPRQPARKLHCSLAQTGQRYNGTRRNAECFILTFEGVKKEKFIFLYRPANGTAVDVPRQTRALEPGKIIEKIICRESCWSIEVISCSMKSICSALRNQRDLCAGRTSDIRVSIGGRDSKFLDRF